jgi:hypothetical protein
LADGEIDFEDFAAPGGGALRAANGEGSAGSEGRGHAYVGVQAFAADRPFGREYGGMLVVGLPLDRVNAGHAPPLPPLGLSQKPSVTMPVAGARPSASAAGNGPAVAGSAPPTIASPSAPTATGAAPLATPPPDDSLRPRDALPAAVVRGCIRAAFRASGLGETDASLDRLGDRARASAWLPELRLRAVRTDDASGRLTTTQLDDGRYVASGGSTNLFEARATFHLDRLVFSEEEVALERVRVARVDARARVAHRVIEVLVAWRRARVKIDDPTVSAEEWRRAEADRADAEIELDVLTDGWFGAAVSATTELGRDR